jgi:hypothetical protein
MPETHRNKHSKFVTIKNLIPQAAAQHQVEKHFIKYKIFSVWEKVILGFFTEAKDATKAIDFKNGTLTVACLSQTLGMQIKQVVPQLLRALNDFLGRNLVYVLIVEM